MCGISTRENKINSKHGGVNLLQESTLYPATPC